MLLILSFDDVSLKFEKEFNTYTLIFCVEKKLAGIEKHANEMK